MKMELKKFVIGRDCLNRFFRVVEKVKGSTIFILQVLKLKVRFFTFLENLFTKFVIIWKIYLLNLQEFGKRIYQKVYNLENLFTNMVETDMILRHNLWWKHGKSFENYDKHLIEVDKVSKNFKRGDIELKPGIYVITGPRQIGKTVWVKKKIVNLLNNKANPGSIFYLSCDALTSRGRKELRRAINFYLETTREFEKTYIFLDEINYVNDWVYEIKSLEDVGAFSKSIVLLTGSSSYDIKRNTELLPGRNIEGNTYFLKPLSFREFVLQTTHIFYKYINNNEMRQSFGILEKKIKDISILNIESNQMENIIMEILPFKDELNYLFNIYLSTGGFPIVINNYLKNKKVTIESSIFETFIRIIVEDFTKQGKRENTARQILLGILKRLGSRYSYSSLSKETETGITHPTIIDYLDLYEKSFIIQIINPYDLNKKQIRAKADKKIYFADPFIYHAVNNWIYGEGFDFVKDLIMNDKNVSVLIEGIVASHLSKLKEVPLTKEPITFLWYYYNRNKEIDFVFKEKNYVGIEVKYQFSPSISEILKIENIKDYIVLTKDKMKIKGNCIFVPVSVFLSLLDVSKRNLQ